MVSITGVAGLGGGIGGGHPTKINTKAKTHAASAAFWVVRECFMVTSTEQVSVLIPNSAKRYSLLIIPEHYFWLGPRLEDPRRTSQRLQEQAKLMSIEINFQLDSTRLFFFLFR